MEKEVFIVSLYKNQSECIISFLNSQKEVELSESETVLYSDDEKYFNLKSYELAAGKPTSLVVGWKQPSLEAAYEQVVTIVKP